MPKISRQKIKLFLLFLLFVPLLVYASDGVQPIEAQQATAVSATPVTATETKESGFMNNLKGFTKSFKANDGYFDFGLRFGYMNGFTSFDLNHHVSELEYPFHSYMGGGNLSLGYKDISMNSEFWGSLFTDPTAGWHMKDKDWANGEIESDTRSNSKMNAVIWDANLRYDFFRYSFSQKKAYAADRKADNVKLGVLIGYRYQRYGFKVDGNYQTATSAEGEPSGSTVLEYKIKYRMPYYGLAVDMQTDKFGILMSGKYAFSPHARDLDNHVLTGVTTYGDYKKKPNVIMANFMMFWKFYKSWRLNAGADVALIRMNGIIWDEAHTPAWDQDQNLDTKQFIYWMGLGYRF